MVLKPPKFWQSKSWVSTMLLPCSWLYLLGAKILSQRRRAKNCASIVICIGNVTAGGAGKTPFAIYLARLMLKSGYQPCFLTKGYGGKLKGPQVVEQTHNADLVGDEAMMLSLVAPTIIACDRGLSVDLIDKLKPDFVIMDDGLQNHSLFKDKSILVIDGFSGLGNCRILPSGPLREYLSSALDKVQAVVIIGEDKTQVRKLLPNDLPIIKANVLVDPSLTVKDKKVIAFAGIGYPEKFFRTLEKEGAIVVSAHNFSDHHRYLESELVQLVADAQQNAAMLITTEKDMVKIPPQFHDQIFALKIGIELTSKDEQLLLDLIISKQ